MAFKKIGSTKQMKIEKFTVEKLDGFINVTGAFENGVVIQFTRNDVQKEWGFAGKEWGFAGDDNWFRTQEESKRLGINPNRFWPIVIPQLEQIILTCASRNLRYLI
jgi:hypothetical protein